MNNIYTIYTDLASIYEDFDGFLNRLSEKRRHKINMISDFDAKVNSLGGALLLNEGAARFDADADNVKYTKKGKPYIENSDFCFSISHSDGFAACSFGNIPSGCDIQVKRDVNLKIAQRFFSEKEKDAVFSSKNPEGEFFKVWCRKESAYKLTGFNDCIIENKHKICFRDFMVSDDVYLNICGFENNFSGPEKIKF